jgi:hypothetical protein
MAESKGKFVRRRPTPVYEIRRKYDAKIAPTQLYAEEKALTVQAVQDHAEEFESISAFCRVAIREKLERMGYNVPPESGFEPKEAEAVTT